MARDGAKGRQSCSSLWYHDRCIRDRSAVDGRDVAVRHLFIHGPRGNTLSLLLKQAY